MSNQAGFNLIELMVVMTIMAILAAIAIPSYSHYIDKGRTVSAVVLTEPVRTEVTEYAIEHNGDLSNANNTSLNLPSSELVRGSQDVTDIQIQGVSTNQVNIIAVLADNLGKLTWVGTYLDGNMSWSCTYPASGSMSHYAPRGCKGI